MLVGGEHGNGTFLRRLVFELQKRKRWWESRAETEELIAVLSALVKQIEKEDLESPWDYEDHQ
jgi:hypothetical protein